MYRRQVHLLQRKGLIAKNIAKKCIPDFIEVCPRSSIAASCS
jgi:hypothetical protein